LVEYTAAGASVTALVAVNVGLDESETAFVVLAVGFVVGDHERDGDTDGFHVLGLTVGFAVDIVGADVMF
jgi:hypothetical protein